MPTPAATISAGQARPMTWENQLEAIGSVVAINGTDVTTEAGGIVTRIDFESGSHVDKGAPLVSLDADNERGELERLKAEAELSQLNLQRREKLFKLEAISKSDLDAAKAQANAARAAVEAQQALVAQKDIRAPFAGQLGIRRVNLGQYLSPGTPIVSLQSVDPIEFEFALPEQYLSQAENGLGVELSVDGYPDTRFSGEVVAIEPRVDEGTRNFALRARLPNPDHKLRAGQFGRVRLMLPGKRDVLAVPRTAINYSSYGTSVFVVREKKAAAEAPLSSATAPGDAQAAGGEPAPAGGTDEPALEVIQRFVRIGEARGDFVEVLEGLDASERVATSGLLKLRNEQPVLIDNTVVPDAELSPQPSES
jgi:membrane fusion protein (multidrug efflux system)